MNERGEKEQSGSYGKNERGEQEESGSYRMNERRAGTEWKLSNE